MKSNDLSQRVKDILKQTAIETARAGIYLSILSITFLPPAIAYEKYWRSTDEGRKWLQAVEKRSEEINKDSKLSDYDKQAKIFSEFYGLR